HSQRPAGAKRATADQQGEDTEEETWSSAEKQVSQDGQRQRQKGEDPEQVDDPGVAAQVGDKSHPGAERQRGGKLCLADRPDQRHEANESERPDPEADPGEKVQNAGQRRPSSGADQRSHRRETFNTKSHQRRFCPATEVIAHIASAVVNWTRSSIRATTVSHGRRHRPLSARQRQTLLLQAARSARHLVFPAEGRAPAVPDRAVQSGARRSHRGALPSGTLTQAAVTRGRSLPKRNPPRADPPRGGGHAADRPLKNKGRQDKFPAVDFSRRTNWDRRLNRLPAQAQ